MIAVETAQTATLPGLKLERGRAKLSQARLAFLSGVALNTIQRAEWGLKVDANTRGKLATALDVPAAALLEVER